MKRRAFIAGLGAVAPLGLMRVTRAQQVTMVRRVGLFTGLAEDDPEEKHRVAAFLQRFEELGWTENRNLRLDHRGGAGDSDAIQASAESLIDLQPDVVLANTAPVVAALMRYTRTIPIVFVSVTDPVGNGFVANLAKPGGNITGFTNFEFSMGGKWLEILKEMVPGTVRIGLIFNPQTAPGGGEYFLRSVETAAPTFRVALMPAHVQDLTAIETAIAEQAREPGGALVFLPDVFTGVHRESIIALTARYRVPAIYPLTYFATGGGLVSYGVDVVDLYRRAADYVDRILRGTNPADLPVQAPNKFELVINLKAAKALGLAVPPTLLARADEVIE